MLAALYVAQYLGLPTSRPIADRRAGAVITLASIAFFGMAVV